MREKSGPNRKFSEDPATLDPDAVAPDTLDDENPQGIIRDFEVPHDGSGDNDSTSDSTDLDNQTDGDRQLTTDSDAIDGGLNDSNLGADEFSENPPAANDDSDERRRY